MLGASQFAAHTSPRRRPCRQVDRGVSMKSATIFGSVVLVGLAYSLAARTQAPKATPAREGIEFFESKIRPVLVAKCYECHSAKASKVRGSLYLDTRNGVLSGGDNGPAIVPGDPGKSLLIRALHHEEGLEMPPKERLPA